jgi:hypothetical protein
MADPIIRTEQEIYDAAMRAQAAAFKAEDAGDTDDTAEGIYKFWQWMTGNASEDPTLELGEGADEEESAPGET